MHAFSCVRQQQQHSNWQQPQSSRSRSSRSNNDSGSLGNKIAAAAAAAAPLLLLYTPDVQKNTAHAKFTLFGAGGGGAVVFGVARMKPPLLCVQVIAPMARAMMPSPLLLLLLPCFCCMYCTHSKANQGEGAAVLPTQLLIVLCCSCILCPQSQK